MSRMEFTQEAERYYHIWCENCQVEQFFDSSTPISDIAEARHQLCPCSETNQAVVEGKNPAFSCEICSEKEGLEETAGLLFCEDCRSGVEGYMEL